MKSKNYFKHAILFIFAVLSMNTLFAQAEKEEKALSKWIVKITAADDFNYREELRTAKASDAQFLINDKKYTDTSILKNMKRAARNADNLSEFESYFDENNLKMLEDLTAIEKVKVYETFRHSTLNGFLDELSRGVGSL